MTGRTAAPAVVAALLAGLTGCSADRTRVVDHTPAAPVSSAPATRSTPTITSTPSAPLSPPVQPAEGDASTLLIPLGSTGADLAPYAWIDEGHVAEIGERMVFDASGSHARLGAVISYAWDFDADGDIDLVETDPEAEHAYAEEYVGDVVLLITDSAGQQATWSTHVAATVDGDETPTERDNCPDVDNHGQSDRDGDGVGDACDPTPGW